MRVRKLDANRDFSFGHGSKNYFIDSPDGVGQIVSTRLQLWTGQWYLNPSEGTDWATKVLGKYTGSTRDPVIQNRILTTPGVLNIEKYASQFDKNTRKFNVQSIINTDYGIVRMAGPI